MSAAPAIAYLANTNDDATLPADSRLWSIVVGTGTATSVVTVYDGVDTNGAVRALINAATAGSYDFFGARFSKGLYVKMTTAAAKVSVVSA